MLSFWASSIVFASLSWFHLVSSKCTEDSNGGFCTVACDRNCEVEANWRFKAIDILWKERLIMDYTPIVHVKIPGMPNVDLIFKNETASPTNNLKHRFSWALFMWALLEGYIDQHTTVVEASSGNMATSEAYFAQKLGIKFNAVVADTVAAAKVRHIEQYGGNVTMLRMNHLDLNKAAAVAGMIEGGFFMNQFKNADKAEEYHETNLKLTPEVLQRRERKEMTGHESVNVFYELIEQLYDELNNSATDIIPDYFVHAAGTGGTISSVGRYVRKYAYKTKIVLSDSQFSKFYGFINYARFSKYNPEHEWGSPGVSGTGFEAGPSGPAGITYGKTISLLPSIVDIAYKVPDMASAAAMYVLKEIGVPGGSSTGCNFVTALSVAAQNKQSTNGTLRIATILADPAHYYEDTYFNSTWIETNFGPLGGNEILNCWIGVIQEAYKEGFDPLDKGIQACRPNIILIDPLINKTIF